MATADREARVLDAVVTLVDSLLDDFDVVDLLTDLAERCIELLDVAAAGLLLGGPRADLRLVAATSDRSEEIELLQLQAVEGPSLDCYRTGQPVSIADLERSSARWPRFVPAAREAGFASVHAVPMRAGGSPVGALGLFGTQTGQLNEADLLVGRSLAHVATVAIVQEHAPSAAATLPRVRSALASRVVVEQAKGFLRERLEITVSEAFSLLRAYARTSGTHLSEVARQLMSEPDTRPTIIDGLRRLADADDGAGSQADRRTGG